MLSALFNQLLMKALEISLSRPWLCSAGKGQGNIWAPNSTGEVANESHRIKDFGKKTLSTVRKRCSFGSSLSLEEFLGLGHLLVAPPLSTLAQSSADAAVTAENCSCRVSPGKAKCPRSFLKQVVFRKRQKAAGKQNAALWEGCMEISSSH